MYHKNAVCNISYKKSRESIVQTIFPKSSVQSTVLKIIKLVLAILMVLALIFQSRTEFYLKARSISHKLAFENYLLLGSERIFKSHDIKLITNPHLSRVLLGKKLVKKKKPSFLKRSVLALKEYMLEYFGSTIYNLK